MMTFSRARQEQGVRLRDNLKKRAMAFVKTYPNPVNQDQLDYVTDALIGFAQQIVDEFDVQRKSLTNIPREMQRAREKQWDTSCGFERQEWSKCKQKLTDLQQTNTMYPPKTLDQFRDCWEQLRWVWYKADDKAQQTPKLR